MKLAKALFFGLAASVMASSPLAHESLASTASDENWMLFDPSVSWQGPWQDPEYSATRVYEVDDDRDGTADRLIILEDSDTLA
jgi:hypothetical protein